VPLVVVVVVVVRAIDMDDVVSISDDELEVDLVAMRLLVDKDMLIYANF
jgi:hypothetical protein